MTAGMTLCCLLKHQHHMLMARCQQLKPRATIRGLSAFNAFVAACGPGPGACSHIISEMICNYHMMNRIAIVEAG